MAIKKWTGTDGSYSTAGNWSPSGVPVNSDTVRIPAGGGNISSGLNQSAVSLTAFIVEEGYTGTIASSAAYLQIVTSRFEFNGGGVSYIDLGTSAISPQVFGTAAGGGGTRGLYLQGSALVTLSVSGGSVGLAVLVGETSTLATARLTLPGASLWCGTGVTLTTWDNHDGDGIIRCALTTLNVYGGTVQTAEVGAITTANVRGGKLTANSTGTITTLNSYGGNTDFRQSDAARTVTTTNKYKGGSINFNKEAVTYTTTTIQDSQTING